MRHWTSVGDLRTIENFFFKTLLNLTSFDAEFNADSEYVVLFGKYRGQKNGLIDTCPLLSTYFTKKKLYIWKIVKFIFWLNPEGDQGYIPRIQIFFKPIKTGEDRPGRLQLCCTGPSRSGKTRSNYSVKSVCHSCWITVNPTIQHNWTNDTTLSSLSWLSSMKVCRQSQNQ